MKFQNGEKVLLLDTEFKPAGSAVVCQYEEYSKKYVVEYIYPDGEKADKLFIPEERLLSLTENE
jgi:hypothetical protein